VFVNLHNPPLYDLVGETIARHGGVKHTMTLTRWVVGSGRGRLNHGMHVYQVEIEQIL
jgi:hypothetical protein